MIQAYRLLIIEDEAGIAVALYTYLTRSGYIVDTAKTGTSGLRKANGKSYDLIILDLGLPDMSGLTICKRLRADGAIQPIIILTAEKTIRSKVELFDAGANDYVTKPFSLDELQARIKTCLRGDVKPERLPKVRAGEITLNPETRTAERGGLIVGLTRKEYRIMEHLVLHAGKVVTRTSLLHYAWNESNDAWTNTVDVHIKHIRDKLDRPFSHQLILTVHGLGYKLLITELTTDKQK